MRFKLTVLLLVLNVALFSIIFYLERVQSTSDLVDASARLILDPDFVQGIQALSIESVHTSQPWTLERSGEQWLVSSPIKWKANPFAVQQLLFQLRQLSWESRFPVSELRNADQNLASYNLQNPPIRLNLQDGSRSLQLSLGAPTEIGNRLYIMSPDGDFVYVVSRGLLDSLQRELETFLDRRIFSLSLKETRALQIQDRAASNVRVRLERREGGWGFVSPIETTADPEKTRGLIMEWLSMEAESFLPGSEIPLAMDSTSIRLTLEGLLQRETLILTPPQDTANPLEYMARREAFPAVFRVSAEQVQELRSVQEELREKRILSAYSEGWTSLEIRFEDLGVTLQQLENGTWQVLYTDDDGQLQSMPAATDAIEDMEQLFATMEAVRFVTDAPSEADLLRFGLQEPQRRLRLRTGNQQRVELRIGGLAPGEEQTLLYAKTDQSDSVFLVRPYVLAALSLDPFQYRERTINRLSTATKIESIRIIHRDSGLEVPLEPATTSPVTQASLMEALRSCLRNTQVARFLGKSFADPLPLGADREISWTYLLQADLRFPSTTGESTDSIEFHLSDRIGGTTQYIGDPDTGLVGTLPIELIEQLDSILAEYPERPSSPPPG